MDCEAWRTLLGLTAATLTLINLALVPRFLNRATTRMDGQMSDFQIARSFLFDNRPGQESFTAGEVIELLDLYRMQWTEHVPSERGPLTRREKILKMHRHVKALQQEANPETLIVIQQILGLMLEAEGILELISKKGKPN